MAKLNKNEITTAYDNFVEETTALAESAREHKKSLATENHPWKGLSDKRGSLTRYPVVPTNNQSGWIGKFYTPT